MIPAADALDTTLPAGGQTLRLPGGDHTSALHDQLYRYAEDLQKLIERNVELQTHYEEMIRSCKILIEGLEKSEDKNDLVTLATRVGGVGIWDFDVVRNTMLWDDQMFVLYGLTQNQFGGVYESWKSAVSPEDAPRIDAEMQRALRGEKEFDTEFRIVWPNGTIRNIRAIGSVARDTSGQPVHMTGTNWDFTERKQMEDRISQLAFYDALTNLPNRRLLNDRLAQSIVASNRSGCYSALMFLDLDNFKPLNDTHGHVVGDLLLMEVASRLKGSVREKDTVARFGGDEFVVMLGDLDKDKNASISHAEFVAEKIRAAVSEPYRLTICHDDQTETTVEHRCTVSIGVVVFIGHNGNQEDFLKWADHAMYQAKKAGRNSIRFHDADGMTS
jgi:diguanylate cyclase (GGDEF)-like protein/PAS domain S-box-containing protein